jgi:predicted transposase YbfD/YdcC
VVVDEQTNEIPVVRDLLDITDVRGCVVTWDALNTRKETVAAVIREHGDYVGALKGNQQTLYEEVELYFDEAVLERLRKEETSYCLETDKERIGAARREYFLSDDIGRLSQGKEWAGLKSIGCVRSALEKLNGEKTVETRYFIVRISDVKVFAVLARGHWQVENKLRWRLDVTFKDGQNRTMRKRGEQHLQRMKRVSLGIRSLVQSYYGNRSLQGIRYTLSLGFEEYLDHLQTA